MKALLTSAGIKNDTIREALVELLGKPIEEASALFVPTALYPFPGGPYMAARTFLGQGPTPLCDLGWKALGLLELTALPSIDFDTWAPTVREADALLFGGGDPLFLANEMRRSGLTALLPEVVYVGVSAGAIAAATTFVETYTEPPAGTDNPVKVEPAVFGDVHRLMVTAEGAGLVDFAVIPHFENPNHPDASRVNAEKWASHIPAATYAIDDDTALKVIDGKVEVVSEGEWKLFPPS
ncbi:Type 1 glutamine amidotransferase-like domain-containing protein [Actinoplanes sp. NPDC049596]|uniref:Type 1 glutamine amidotransferase-like domain-containing protein n=1 Tax=unclassified Actinoplanes TaxID=2626549 RepID=UPI00342C6EC5